MGLESINTQKTHSQFTHMENLPISKSDSAVRSTLASKSSNAEAPWYQPIANFFYSCWSTLKYYLTCSCFSYEDKRPVEEQLKEFFSSEEKTQKIFAIGDEKVGIIFNPKGGAINEGNFKVGDSIMIISEKQISEKSMKKIESFIPEKYTFSQSAVKQYNGQSPFKAFGLE